jgi:hypothetical protein
LTRMVDCSMLLEADGCDFGDFAPAIRKHSIIMSRFAELAKTSRDLQSVKSWLGSLRKRNWHVNVRTENGTTPLMLAADSLPTLRLMLACGADVSLKDDFGSQALHRALMFGVPKFIDCSEVANPEWYESLVGIVTCLIEAGADIFALDNRGRGPVELACLCDHIWPFVKALERCGLSVENTVQESFQQKIQWEADRRRLHDATRTAVDAEIQENPSTEGLRKRRRLIFQPGDDD